MLLEREILIARSNVVPRLTLSHMRSGALAGVLLIAACGAVSGTSTTTTILPTTSLTTPPPIVDPVLGCPEDTEFSDEGRVVRIDQPNSDTRILGLISWQVEEGCERFGLDFETTEGAPATTPPSVVVEFLSSRQVLRIHLDVEETVITDQLVETDLVDRLYVVRALDGGMFVDLHLGAAAAARASISNSPARLTVEIQPGSEELEAFAATSDLAVVVIPPEGSTVGGAVEVSGYARTFESNVLIIATSGDELVAETNVTAADSENTWGEFEATVELPAGDASIFAGEEDAEDGGLVGVTVNVMVR